MFKCCDDASKLESMEETLQEDEWDDDAEEEETKCDWEEERTGDGDEEEEMEKVDRKPIAATPRLSLLE